MLIRDTIPFGRSRHLKKKARRPGVALHKAASRGVTIDYVPQTTCAHERIPITPRSLPTEKPTECALAEPADPRRASKRVASSTTTRVYARTTSTDGSAPHSHAG